MAHTVMITGAAGFIGSHLSMFLTARGHRVIGIDNFDPFYPRVIKEQNLALLREQADFSFIEADIRKPNELLSIPAFDTVMHLAAKAGVRPSIEAPSEYIDTNIHGTHNILKLCLARGCRKMVFASSSSIYGNSEHLPFIEDGYDYAPISPYAATKRSNELINYTYHHLYDVDVMNLRFFTVYGPRQRPDLAIHKFAKLMSEGKTIPMYGDGSTARDYTYIDDTVSGIYKAMEYIWSKDGIFDTVNLGNSHPIKLTELISTLGEAMGVKPEIQQLPMQDGDVDITFADIRKASRLFGYEPQINFKEGIKRFVHWYVNQFSQKA